MDNVLLQTSDIETANQLRQLGYKEIKSSNGLYTFLNDVTIGTFANGVDKKKIVYSNKMTF